MLLVLFIGCAEAIKVYSEINNVDKHICTWQDIDGMSKQIKHIDINDADIIILKWDSIKYGNRAGRCSGNINDGCYIESINNKRVILHELGHCFNYKDVEDRNSIMCRYNYTSATNFVSLEKD